MISICTAYYNRKPQFLLTLESIAQSAYKDIEIIVVDDGSAPEHRLEGLPIKLIRMEPEERNWVNPCIPFNRAINAAIGDIVIIQNPECMHIGDILNYTIDNLRKYQYMAFSCFSWDVSPIDLSKIKSVQSMAGGQGQLGWYNHSKICPRPYHFCTAVHKENLGKLRGFDERFKDGPCYDDDDLVRRVRKLGLQIKHIDDPFVIHQWHDSSHIYQEDSHQRFLENQKIYHKILSGELESWS